MGAREASNYRRRVEQEAELVQKHSPGLPDRRAEQLARVHVLEQRDMGAGQEQEKVGRLAEDGRARCYE